MGGSPESEFAQLGEPLDVFRKLLGKNYIYNKTKLQSGKYSINSCGAWVLARAKLAFMKLREFTGLFRRISLQNADDIVSALVLLDFANKD